MPPVLIGIVCIPSTVCLLQHGLEKRNVKKKKEKRKGPPASRRFLIGQDDEMIAAWECTALLHELAF